MAKTELQKKSEKELIKDLQEARKEIREFRFGMSGSQTRDSKKGSNLKLKISQIMTELNAR